VILLGSVGWLDPFIGGHVVGLGERPDAGAVVAAVRTGPGGGGVRVPRALRRSYSTEPGVVVCRARYAAASARRATSSFERIDET